MMLLALVFVLFSRPQTGVVVKAEAERPVSVSAASAKDSSSSSALPSVPHPKIKTDAEIEDSLVPTSLLSMIAQPLPIRVMEPDSPAEPIVPGSSPPALKPANTDSYETPRRKKIWYTLTFASSGAAAVDAWSTRRAITGGYGTEENPVLRPFAHSGAMYAATQVSSLAMDYIGHRMMTSRHPLLRRMWWLPQSVGTGFSLAAGIHNVGVAPTSSHHF
jgi:hypothetical protein